ncbi:MAG TPA: tetratricopeptide repeat protein [Dehalococcoidia bacterium]|nr:tetratricopeptide repeat protein [Dehalococcoidia bacterium]
MTERSSQEEMGSPIDYFAILGVSRDAGQDEIEARYRELSGHLVSAAIPAALKEWATREAALVDEAYAILSDPERRAELEQAPRAVPAAAASPVAAVAPQVPVAEYDDISAPEITRATPGERPVSALNALFMGVPWKLMAIGAVIGVVVLGAIFFGNDLISGGGDDSSSGGQEDQLAKIDMERVADLTALVEQDPKNAEATFELGEIFFLGGEWQTGIDWFTKLLELDPTNVHALTDVGTAQFNLGQFEAAKTAWLKARELDPNDEQVHYNLGFLYANVDPVDYAAALAEWQLVVELAPGSDLANTAQVHLESLAAEASAAPTPAATANPGG